MTSQRLSTDLGFLTDAAHLLRQTAPETSAYLMRSRAELMHHNGLAQHETQRQHVCGACGHIMIQGQQSKLTLERCPRSKAPGKRTGSERSAAKASTMTKQGPAKSIICGLCKRITRIRLPPPQAVHRRKKLQMRAAGNNSNVAVPELDDHKPTANASSKKRAKNRKGGLQALLAGQQNKPGSSLSLADFMS
ncbi:hypothetical protein E4U58_002845 [Claviceps cyperi]|nr:hypothetical protein E4U58_002845 [Claviceps cyperi]